MAPTTKHTNSENPLFGPIRYGVAGLAGLCGGTVSYFVLGDPAIGGAMGKEILFYSFGLGLVWPRRSATWPPT